MPPVGKITMMEVDGDTVVSDESGVSCTIKDTGNEPTLEVDPRIDMTKPIWEQARRLARQDAAKERATKIRLRTKAS